MSCNNGCSSHFTQTTYHTVFKYRGFLVHGNILCWLTFQGQIYMGKFTQSKQWWVWSFPGFHSRSHFKVKLSMNVLIDGLLDVHVSPTSHISCLDHYFENARGNGFRSLSKERSKAMVTQLAWWCILVTDRTDFNEVMVRHCWCLWFLCMYYFVKRVDLGIPTSWLSSGQI